MSWKSLGRTVVAALAVLTLAAASPAAAQPRPSAKIRPAAIGFFEQIADAIRQRIAALWAPIREKGCQECTEQGPGSEPPGSTTTPACEGCGDQGPVIDPHG